VITEVEFRPYARTCTAVGGAAPGSLKQTAHTATIEEGTSIDMLDINLDEYKDAEVAKVRFFPNGTCDEMMLILTSDKHGQRGITLEITTGLATVLTQVDLQKLRYGRL
jgi:hypothetical protein